MVRFKNRYLLIEALPVDDHHRLTDYAPSTCPSLTSNNLATHLRTTLTTNFGLLPAALTSHSLSVKYCNAATGTAIVRAPRDLLGWVAASVCLMGAPEGGRGKWIWRVVRVAGTIRGAQKAAMHHATARLETAFRAGLLKEDSKTNPGGSSDNEKFNEMIFRCRKAIKAINP